MLYFAKYIFRPSNYQEDDTLEWRFKQKYCWILSDISLI